VKKNYDEKTTQTAYEAYFSSYASVTTMEPQQAINIYTAQSPMCVFIFPQTA